jgi:VRR-NUC domain
VVKRNPRVKSKRNHGEYSLQCNFFKWLYYTHRELYDITFAIPNGGKRDEIEAYHLKMQGVKRGVPDVFMPYSTRKHHGLFIEFKWGVNTTTPAQKEFIESLINAGYCVEICYTFDEAVKVFEEYLKSE